MTARWALGQSIRSAVQAGETAAGQLGEEAKGVNASSVWEVVEETVEHESCGYGKWSRDGRSVRERPSQACERVRATQGRGDQLLGSPFPLDFPLPFRLDFPSPFLESEASSRTSSGVKPLDLQMISIEIPSANKVFAV